MSGTTGDSGGGVQGGRVGTEAGSSHNNGNGNGRGKGIESEKDGHAKVRAKNIGHYMLGKFWEMS